jgi:hypothetical protein
MDADGFDSLVQQLTQARSRRRALAGLLGGVLAGTLRGEVGAKPKGRGRGVKTAQHTKRRPSAADAKCRSTGQTCSEKHPCCASLACEPREHGSGRCAPCIPKTCAELGKNCGPVSDTCGGLTPSCGECTAPNTCGGGGTANVCGRPTVTCSADTPCPPGADCLGGTCSCRARPCPLGNDNECTPDSGQVCNASSSTLRCCCSPTGNPLGGNCIPGLNAFCCSGFCGSDGRCADPPI